MNITPEEAQVALNDIRRLTDKTQYISKVWAFYMVLWGLIWTVGFLASQMLPNLIDWIWYTMNDLCMNGRTRQCNLTHWYYYSICSCLGVTD